MQLWVCPEHGPLENGDSCPFHKEAQPAEKYVPAWEQASLRRELHREREARRKAERSRDHWKSQYTEARIGGVDAEEQAQHARTTEEHSSGELRRLRMESLEDHRLMSEAARYLASGSDDMTRRRLIRALRRAIA